MDFEAGEQFRADEIEALGTALIENGRRFAQTQFEHVADFHRNARRADLDRLDLLCASAHETVRREGRKIQTLLRLMAQSEGERLHGRRSFK
jgi:hypothetical protein